MLTAHQAVGRLLHSGRKCVAVGKNFVKHIDEVKIVFITVHEALFIISFCFSV